MHILIAYTAQQEKTENLTRNFKRKPSRQKNKHWLNVQKILVFIFIPASMKTFNGLKMNVKQKKRAIRASTGAANGLSSTASQKDTFS